MTRAGLHRAKWLVVALGGALLAFGGVALSATDTLVYSGCIANDGTDGCHRPAHDSLGGTGIAVSPDGHSVYATGSRSAINHLERSASGELHYLGCVANSGRDGCRNPDHRSLLYPTDVAVSPDGRSLYVTGARGTLTLFRIGNGGSLHYRGCIADFGQYRCRKSDQAMLNGAEGVVVSPDGRFVYVASSIFGAVNRFRIGRHGAMSPAGCISDLPIVHCRKPRHDSLYGIDAITMSPDGRTVYVASPDSLSVTWFTRSRHGKLRYGGCIANRGFGGCRDTGHRTLGGITNLAVSPDGKSVYAAAEYSDAVTWFDRLDSGALRYSGCVANKGRLGCSSPGRNALRAAWGVTVSPDGGSVYVTSAAADSITLFDRSPTGSLRYVSCIADKGKNGCRRAGHPSLEYPIGIAVSPDGGSVYVNSARRGPGGAISSFERVNTP